MLPNGNTAIVWEEEVYGPWEVGYAIIDGSGTVVVGPSFISGSADIYDPSVAATPGGNIVIVWEEEVSGDDYDVFYTILDGSGNEVKPIAPATTSTEDDDDCDVAIDQNGNMVISWEDEIGSDRIAFDILDSSGAILVSNVPLTDGTHHDVDIDGAEGRRSIAALESVCAQPPPAPVLPVADFSAEPTGGRAPLTVQFTDRSTGSITTRRWDFGDGDTSNKQNPTHRYTHPGKYTVTLKVSSPGGTDTKVKKQYISVSKKPSAERPARFLATYPHIVPTRVLPNQPVNVLLNVKNVAASGGQYNAVLYVNGELEDSQSAYISPGQTQRLVFIVCRATPGDYWVSVGGYGAWFTVAEAAEVTEYKVEAGPPSPSAGPGTPTILAIVLGSVGAGVAVFFATRRRRI